MNRWTQTAATIVATVFFWLTALLVSRLATESEFTSGVAMLVAVGGSVFVWMMWTYEMLGRPFEDAAAPAPEKAKREIAGDDRAALLLSLLSDDERQALKQRLVEDLQGDGEAVSLADLLGAQERRHGGS